MYADLRMHSSVFITTDRQGEAIVTDETNRVFFVLETLPVRVLFFFGSVLF